MREILGGIMRGSEEGIYVGIVGGIRIRKMKITILL
jgi:hypothetical protein